MRQGAGGVRGLAGWEACWTPLGEGEAGELPRGRGSGWEPVEVPAQQAASEGRQSIWYRTSFPRPDHSGRVLLRVGGAFLAANVWLNGRLLGSHYGYFAPFGFDLTPYLKPDNLLVVCCESPVETDLARKCHAMGIFNDGDSRPYPSSAYFSLPEPYRWEVPVGLWRPVELEYLGPLAIERMRLLPRMEAGVGRLGVEVRLRNLDGREMKGEARLEVRAGPDPVRLHRELRIPGGVEQTVQFEVSVPGAQRWWPWRLGEPHLNTAAVEVAVEDRPSAAVEDSFGFREVEISTSPAWAVHVNGRPFFLRGANYMPDLRLDALDKARFEADLALAREANLDALRVHAHVLPEEFYRLADAAGFLVLADLPLTRSYAYHASPEESRFFEESVRAMVPEMVELLRNRPSVALWVAHDDPPWIRSNAEMADVHAVRQNYTADQDAMALFRRLDPSRAALAASGELDSHLYLGWSEGAWSGLHEAEPGLVSEFGAQALPSASSPVWEEIGKPRAWPVEAGDPAWLYRGFQPPNWADRGVGLPEEHASFQAYVEAGQEYQAWLVTFAVDQFRKRKLDRCWGAFVYHLVDSFPGIGFGLVDHARVKKRAYAALTEAMAPLRVILDPLGFTPLAPAGICWAPGEAAVRVVVVNDDPEAAGRARLRWSADREQVGGSGHLARLGGALRRRSFGGEVEFQLPRFDEPAAQVTVIHLPAAAAGVWRIVAEMQAGGRSAASGLEFWVGATPAGRRRRLLPGYLAERLLEAGSLRREPDGLSFALLNRTRPAALTAVGDLRLDGAPLPGARIAVDTGSGRMPLPRRLELPVGRPVRLAVEAGSPLEPGPHQLEVDLTVPGVADGRALVEGQVAAEDLRPPDMV
ncbi:MAG: glycoside hydrolase family 2 protein [Candidatus Dormibacterales bacterium]